MDGRCGEAEHHVIIQDNIDVRIFYLIMAPSCCIVWMCCDELKGY